MKHKFMIAILAAMLTATPVFAEPNTGQTTATSAAAQEQTEENTGKEDTQPATEEDADTPSMADMLGVQGTTVDDLIAPAGEAETIQPCMVTLEYVFDDGSADIWAVGSATQIANGVFVTYRNSVIPTIGSPEYEAMASKKKQPYQTVEISLEDPEEVRTHLKPFLYIDGNRVEASDMYPDSQRVAVIGAQAKTDGSAVFTATQVVAGQKAKTFGYADEKFTEVEVSIAGVDENSNVRYTGANAATLPGSLMYDENSEVVAMVTATSNASGVALDANAICQELEAAGISYMRAEAREQEVEEVELNSSGLDAVIEEAKQIDASRLKEDSASKLLEAIKAAESAKKSAEEQATIDNAEEDIKETLGALEYQPIWMRFLPLILGGVGIIGLIIGMIFVMKKIGKDGLQATQHTKKAKKTRKISEKKRAPQEEEAEDDDFEDDDPDVEEGTTVLKSTGSAYLIRIDNGKKVWINKNRFVIGQRAGKVDYLIRDNPTISREHCVITKQNDQYFVTDKNSSNYSYINENELAPEKKAQIKDGDILRLSNVEFEFHKD